MNTSSSLPLPQSAGWSDLRPGMFGHIARYLPMETASVEGKKEASNSDDSDNDGVSNTGKLSNIMSLLLCIGRNASAVVRKMYLTGSRYYLQCLRRCYVEDDIPSGSKYNALRSNILCWMDYNEELWKEISRGKLSAKNVLTLTIDVAADDTRTEEEEVAYMFKSTFRSDERFVNVHLNRGNQVVDKFTGSGSAILTSVGDRVVYPLTTNDVSDEDDERIEAVYNDLDVFDMIEKEEMKYNGEMPVTFMRDEDCLFNHPPTVIELGLDMVLRYMVEEKIVDVNTKYYFCGEDVGHYPFPLIFHALQRYTRNLSCLSYLVSLLKESDVNAEHHFGLRFRAPPDRISPIHFCILYGTNGALKILLSHPEIEVNKQDSDGLTALLHLFIEAECDWGQWNMMMVDPDYSDEYATVLESISALLRAGADPELPGNNGNTPLAVAKRSRLHCESMRPESIAEMESEAGKLRLWERILATLRDSSSN